MLERASREWRTSPQRDAPSRTKPGNRTHDRAYARAIAMAREVLDKLKWNGVSNNTVTPNGVSPAPTGESPKYSPDELLGIVPADDREPYDVREVIARIVDTSDFLEFKVDYAADTVCGHARINGHHVGILACIPDGGYSRHNQPGLRR